MKFKVDFKDFEKFTDKVAKIAKQDLDRVSQKLFEEMLKELMSRLLAKVIERTPVGEYGPKEVHFVTKEGKEVNFMAKSYKTGGTLKRGWSVGEVIKNGSVYTVEIVNPVHYATYVEYGHRTRNHKGWIEGRFMLTISEEELKREASVIIEKKIENFLEDYINGNA
mgnify:FL=1